DVADQEGLIPRDADARPLEYRESADAAGDVRNDGRSRPRRHDDVAGVGEQVRRLRVAVEISELQVRRRRKRRADLTLEADVPIEVEGDGRAEAKVAEAGRRVFRRDERGAYRDVGDFDDGRPRRGAAFLRVHVAAADDECCCEETQNLP